MMGLYMTSIFQYHVGVPQISGRFGWHTSVCRAAVFIMSGIMKRGKRREQNKTDPLKLFGRIYMIYMIDFKI